MKRLFTMGLALAMLVMGAVVGPHLTSGEVKADGGGTIDPYIVEVIVEDELVAQTTEVIVEDELVVQTTEVEVEDEVEAETANEEVMPVAPTTQTRVNVEVLFNDYDGPALKQFSFKRTETNGGIFNIEMQNVFMFGGIISYTSFVEMDDDYTDQELVDLYITHMGVTLIEWNYIETPNA